MLHISSARFSSQCLNEAEAAADTDVGGGTEQPGNTGDRSE